MAYKIGATSGTMTDLKTLGIPYPKGEFFNYADLRQLGDGTVRGVGAPRVVWAWGFLTRTQRDALRTYCTGASSAVYIETRTLDSTDAFDQFSATMIWPNEGEERSAGRRLAFEIEFRNLVAL